MNWNSKDIQIYLKEKEYIDTAVIPLIPIAFGEQMKRAAEQGEFIQLLVMHLEKQFKGRIVVLPGFTYVNDPEEESERLKDLLNKTFEGGFSHVFVLTADQRWNIPCKEMENFFYVPSIPLEHLDDRYKHTVMEDQLKNLIPTIIKSWQ